jgi:hypothetical protein
MRLSRFVQVAVVAVIGSPLGAQVPRPEPQLAPMTFAKVSDSLWARFAADWKTPGWTDTERKYCVTHWTAEVTPDGDSLYIATDAVLQARRGTRHSVPIEGECIGPAGPYPVAHTHPGGDCTPSRGDITQSWMRRAPFDLIICAGAYTGYSWTNLYVPYIHGPRRP